MRIVMLLTATAALTTAAGQELRSQQPRVAASREASVRTDPIGRIFRDALVEVAKAGEMPRLDSTALLGGVRREIRIYSIGFGQPHAVLRLIQHTHGVDGQFGLFWLASDWYRVYSSPEEKRRAREEDRALDAQLRALVDTAYDCRAVQQTRLMSVCWLAPKPGRVVWAQLLAQLDGFGIDSIPPQARPMGLDGWSSLVEVRTALGYRAYHYWVPDSTSANAGERAAAGINKAVWEAFKHRTRR